MALKHYLFSTTEKDEIYLNMVLEYMPETVSCCQVLQQDEPAHATYLCEAVCVPANIS
jgi:hypothetical protein